MRRFVIALLLATSAWPGAAAPPDERPTFLVAFTPDGGRIVIASHLEGIVDHTNMRLSTDGRYALIKGSCEADKKRWDACILNLEDGSTVARTKFIYNDKYFEAARHERAMAFPADDYPEFVEALYKTKLRSTGDADEKAAPGSSFHVDAYSFCSELGKGSRFCYSSSVVTGSSNGGAEWRIDVRDDLEARMITSFAASADGHWIALGIDSVSVLLFDTGNLDSGAPKLVKEFEMP